ncbi:deoxynucleoside kinase [Anaerolineales bacterium]
MLDEKQYFIGIAGNIGAGKSTLTAMLAQSFKWEAFYEANAENPYLEDFYQDMTRWSFHSQVFFLGKRLEHHHQIIACPGSAVQDRTVYEDAEIFARNLYMQGQISERDYRAYRNLYQAVQAFLPPPDLLIYLESSVDTLVQHIQKRGRDYERQIERDYLEQLNYLYKTWIEDWTACPILKINTNGLDFQHNPADYQLIVNQIQQRLFEQSL